MFKNTWWAVVLIPSCLYAMNYEFDNNIIEDLKQGIKVMTDLEGQVGPDNGALQVYKALLSDLKNFELPKLLEWGPYQRVKPIVEFLKKRVEDDIEYNIALKMARESIKSRDVKKILKLWHEVSEHGIEIIRSYVEHKGIIVLREMNHLGFLQSNHDLNPESHGPYIIAAIVMRCWFMQIRNDAIKELRDELIDEKYIQ